MSTIGQLQDGCCNEDESICDLFDYHKSYNNSGGKRASRTMFLYIALSCQFKCVNIPTVTHSNVIEVDISRIRQ